jgi:hypothetical protein
MLMGSTQGASLSIAHDGAFYGERRWTRPALYKLFKDQCKDKSHEYLHVPPHVCRRLPPPGRMPTKHCRMPQHTPFHSIVTIYDTPPLTLFSETSTSNVHCS